MRLESSWKLRLILGGISFCLAALIEGDAFGGTNTYSYDDAGRLVSATTNGGTQTKYQLDAAGNRIAVGAPPIAPTNLQGIGGDGQVSLTWTSAPGALTYSVYEGNASGQESGTPVKTGISSASSVITGLTNGSTYSFTVAGVDAVGEGPHSNQVFATLIPLTPTNLLVTAKYNSVDLTWTASAGAATYNIYMGVSPGAESASPAMTGVISTATGISGLTNGTQYYFVAKALNSSGISSASNEVSATPNGVPPPGATGPITPSTQTQSSSPISAFSFSWAAASGTVADYYVWRLSGDADVLAKDISTSASGNLATYVYNSSVSTLLPPTGGCVQYRVQACNVDGCGPKSAVATVMYKVTSCSGGGGS